MRMKLFNKNFLLLLQGKLVSNMGDVLYSVALSYWILETTGSKTIMGMILAMQTFVKVLFSPFGGVVSDRMSRKGIIVGSDFICGCILSIVSVLGFIGRLEIWMMMLASMMMAMAAAFFQPAVQAILPDLVAKENLSKALSANQTTVTLVQIIGQSVSGVLLSIFGPLMIFFGNGMSYFLSSFSEAWIQVPRRESTGVSLTFLEDFKRGLSFMLHHQVLKNFMLFICVLNFFGKGAFVLLLPYFMENSAFCGTTGYGFATAFMTGGTLISVMLYGFLKLNGKQRYLCWLGSILVESIGIVMCTSARNLMWIIIALVIFGFGNALMNIIFSEIQYEIIPDDKRGKVMGLLSTLSMGLTPISMAFFSMMADVVGTYPMLCLGFLTIAGGSLSLLFYKPIIKFISKDEQILQMNISKSFFWRIKR